jgi:hypothetical protein
MCNILNREADSLTPKVKKNVLQKVKHAYFSVAETRIVSSEIYNIKRVI